MFRESIFHWSELSNGLPRPSSFPLTMQKPGCNCTWTGLLQFKGQDTAVKAWRADVAPRAERQSVIQSAERVVRNSWLVHLNVTGRNFEQSQEHFQLTLNQTESYLKVELRCKNTHQFHHKGPTAPSLLTNCFYASVYLTQKLLFFINGRVCTQVSPDNHKPSLAAMCPACLSFFTFQLDLKKKKNKTKNKNTLGRTKEE